MVDFRELQMKSISEKDSTVLGNYHSPNESTPFLRKRSVATPTLAHVAARPTKMPTDLSSATGAVRSLALNILVLRFVVVNAETNEDLFVLQDGQVLDTATLPDFSVRVETQPPKVGSVSFSLDGVIIKTENFRLYCITCDTSSGHRRWSVSPGRHVVSATQYTRRG